MHQEFMDEAIKEAEISLSEGGIPIGAVLVKDNEVISRGHNRLIQIIQLFFMVKWMQLKMQRALIMTIIENAPFTLPFHLVQCVLELYSYTISQEWL